MIISLKNKGIFIGVPHTGSTSIHEHVKHAIMDHETMLKVGWGTYVTEDWIYDHGDYKHASLGEIERYLIDNGHDTSGEWNAYYSFRDPIGYHSSEYFLKTCHWKRKGRDGDWRKNATEHYSKLMDRFSELYPTLEDYLSRLETSKLDDHYKRLEYKHLRRVGGKMNITLHRTDYDRENYHRFFSIVCEGLGVPVGEVIKHENDSQESRDNYLNRGSQSRGEK
jgi:hypothetical protein